MVTHNNSTHRQPGRVARLYDDLDAAIIPLAGDRLEALGELLTMADLETKLRSAIKADGRTHYALGKAAAVTPDVLDRFVSGQRGLNLSTASKVAAVLGLGLFPIAKRTTKTPSSSKLKISR